MKSKVEILMNVCFGFRIEIISLENLIYQLNMKTITSAGKVIFLLMSMYQVCAAQKISIKVNEETSTIGGNKKNALIVSIFEVPSDEILTKWKALMKTYKAKISSSEEVFADNAIIAPINGNNTIDIWAKTEKISNDEIKFVTAFDLGGALLSSTNNTAKFNEAKKILHDFAVKTMKEAIIEKRKAAEKVLFSLQDDQEDLVKEQNKLTSNIDDYKAKIEEYNKKIKDAQDGLAKNKGNQEKKKVDIDAQKKVVEAAVAKEAAVE
jgi:hypothetical protein